jgi:cytochrome c biogenesis protein CcmG/thiol:disulfide interchange protein DsbE
LRTFLPLAVFATVCLSSCSSKQVNAGSTEPSKHRTAAADFTLKDADGASVKLSDYRGKVVLLNFWATWCGPCGVEVPWFTEFEQRYKSQGFAVLGVSMDEDGWSAVKPYVADHKINYRVLLGNDTIAQLYGGLDSLPTSFVIDKAGKVAFPPHIGLISKNEYVNEIECLLGDKPVTSVPAASLSTRAALACPAK